MSARSARILAKCRKRLVGAMEVQSLVSSFLGAAPNTSAERFDPNRWTAL